ncbi:MAG: type III pantothenate kinase [Proteobacteria bacterium]|nr:type III pantothenate kinase [Pseudomonadota bacterium]
MKLLVFDELSSTNDYLIDLYKNKRQGYTFPLAVMAHSQTSGKGQMRDYQGESCGKKMERAVWDSPYGNMHLSILFPGILSPLSSLCSAWIVARFIEKKLSFCPTLKWPNDIWVCGKKLAGILCEGESEGDGYVCIGIGINILVDTLKADYPVTSLQALMNRDYDVESCARELVGYFSELFNGHFSLSSCLRYFPCIKTLCFDSTPQSYVYWWGVDKQGYALVKEIEESNGDNMSEDTEDKPSEDKAVKLKKLASGSSLKNLAAVSLQHVIFEVGNSHLRCVIYQQREHEALVTDTQNQSVLLAQKRWLYSEVFVSWSFVDVKRLDVSSLELSDGFCKDIAEWLNRAKRIIATGMLMSSGRCLSSRLVVTALSTQPLILKALRRGLSEIFSDILIYEPCKRTLRLQVGSYPLKELGMDRLCFLEGILYKFKHYVSDSKIAFMAISFGTAITVDVCGFDGTFRGGVICPGEYVSADALYRCTAGLPMIMPSELGSYESYLGCDSRSCLQAGLFVEKIGALRLLFSSWLCEQNGPYHVFITGGGASLYKPYLQKALQQELDRHSHGASGDMSSGRNKDKEASPKSSLHIHQVDVAMDGLWMVMNAADGYE